MSDPPNDMDTPDIEPAKAERATPLPKPDEEARSRRIRWLTLAEVLGVAALIISGLTLWNNVTMRQSQESARADQTARETRAQQIADREKALVTLSGTARHSGRTLLLKDLAGHNVQSIDVKFPPELDVGPQSAVLDPRIEADWVASKLLKVTDGGPDHVEGRLPIEITSAYWDGDQHRSDSAIYDLVFTTEGRFLGGRALHLKGVVLVQRVDGDAGARLDALWTTERARLDRNKKR